MELNIGFKQTEIGAVPNDWDVSSLKGISTQICDGTHFTPKYVSSGVPFYSVENITANDFVNTKFITKEEHQQLIKRCKPERGDILMTRITAGILGDTKLIDWDVDASIYVSLALIKLKKDFNGEYIYRYTKSPAFRREIEKRGLVNATPKKINMNEIGAVPIPLPKSSKEQEAIANALSDADAYIESLEKLIAKNRLIKKGVMQELLTGKRRLEGFNDVWKTNSLENLVHYRRGSFPQPYGLDKWYDDVSGFPFIQVVDVDDNFRLKDETKRKISEAAKQLSVFIPKGTIILTIQGSIGRIAITEYDACIDRTLLIFEQFKVKFDKEFFKYAIHALFEIEKQKAPGGIIKTITKEALSKFILHYPSIDEQIEIGRIISDLEKEILTSEAKLQKARLLKQGMMQELLTGRIRLV